MTKSPDRDADPAPENRPGDSDFASNGAPHRTTADIFARLMSVIESRRDNPSPRSYTTSLLQGGVAKMGAKIMEEARETVEAGQQLEQAPDGAEQREHLIYETGDLLYHLFVLLGYHQIQLEEVAHELARRFGTSGLDEKANRRRN